MSRSRVMAMLVAVCLGPCATLGQAEDTLVPTRAEAQLKRGEAIARSLESSISSMPGVASARVHVALPAGPAFAEPLAEPSRASVLVHASGAGPRLDHAAVQRLVAGAVPGLDPGSVVVVEVPAVASRPDEPKWKHVGPFIVAEAGASGLRGALMLLLGTQALLAVLLVRAVRQARRRRSHVADGGSP